MPTNFEQSRVGDNMTTFRSGDNRQVYAMVVKLLICTALFCAKCLFNCLMAVGALKHPKVMTSEDCS